MWDLLGAVLILTGASLAFVWLGMRLAGWRKGRYAIHVALADVGLILWFAASLHGQPRLLQITERQTLIADQLVVFVALTRQEHNVTRVRHLDGMFDRRLSIGFDHDRGGTRISVVHACEDVIDD